MGCRKYEHCSLLQGLTDENWFSFIRMCFYDRHDLIFITLCKVSSSSVITACPGKMTLLLKKCYRRSCSPLSMFSFIIQAGCFSPLRDKKMSLSAPLIHAAISDTQRRHHPFTLSDVSCSVLKCDIWWFMVPSFHKLISGASPPHTALTGFISHRQQLTHHKFKILLCFLTLLWPFPSFISTHSSTEFTWIH